MLKESGPQANLLPLKTQEERSQKINQNPTRKASPPIEAAQNNQHSQLGNLAYRIPAS